MTLPPQLLLDINEMFESCMSPKNQGMDTKIHTVCNFKLNSQFWKGSEWMSESRIVTVFWAIDQDAGEAISNLSDLPVSFWTVCFKPGAPKYVSACLHISEDLDA